jgi:putative endonuclease
LDSKDFNQKKSLGKQGEIKALQYLQAKGYRLLEKNLKLPPGEIDLILKDQDTLVFVEVRSTSKKRGSSFERLFPFSKQRKLRQLARSFELSQEGFKAPVRFDIVSIEGSYEGPDEPRITHIQNALEA